MCVGTLVSHRIGEFGQVWQQLSLQADWCQAEIPEEGLSRQTVLPVLKRSISSQSALLLLNLNVKATKTEQMF